MGERAIGRHLTLCALLSACNPSNPTVPTDASAGAAANPAASASAAAAELVVLTVKRDGSVLGSLRLPPGEAGTLTLTASTPVATTLRERWDAEVAKGQISVKMHTPRKDGERGPLGARVYRVGAPNYAEGARLWLLSEGYEAVETTP